MKHLWLADYGLSTGTINKLKDRYPKEWLEYIPNKGLTLDQVRKAFEKALAIIEPRSKPMAEALRNARLHQIVNNEIYFHTFEKMKKRFEKPQPKIAINEAFSQVLGQAVSVRFFSDIDQPTTTEPVDELLEMVTEELGGEIVSQEEQDIYYSLSPDHPDHKNHAYPR